MQYSIKKLTIKVVLKMFSIAVVQTKIISCNSANKSCLLQVVHTKAIAALTQFCDFLNLPLFGDDVSLTQQPHKLKTPDTLRDN